LTGNFPECSSTFQERGKLAKKRDVKDKERNRLRAGIK